MSDPGRRHGFSTIAPKSTSRMERPSMIPVAVGSMVGCEGGAVTGGRVDGSKLPSSRDADSDSGG